MSGFGGGGFSPSPNNISGDATVSGKLGIGTNSPTAILQVSSSAGIPLFRVDHSTQAGAEPIFFVSGSGLVAIGTDTPRTDADDTNRLHIMGESGADNGQNPVVNTVLTLENNGHANLQFLVPNSKAGQITWGNADDARKATHYFDTNGNFWNWEGRATGTGYGNCRVMTLQAAGDSINIGKSNAAHMQTMKACLHISSSTTGTDKGGPVLLRVEHEASADPILFVSGSGQVGIGTATPTQAVDINSDSFRLRTAKTPSSAGATGDQGTIAWDANYLYVATSNTVLKRIALSTF